jgi:hypothetical protein
MAFVATVLAERKVPLRGAMAEFERLFLLLALKKYRGNSVKTAEKIGVHRNTIRNKAAEYGLGEMDLAALPPRGKRKRRDPIPRVRRKYTKRPKGDSQ